MPNPSPPPAGPDARPRAPLWPYAVVVLAAVALFAPFFFQGRVFLAADTLRRFLPWSSSAPADFQPHNMLITDPVDANYPALYNRQLKTGGLAQWNPYIMMGLPATEVTAMMGAPGRSFPLKLLLHRILPVTTAYMLLNFVYLCLMGGTMFAFLHAVGAGVRGALFGAVAFMLNGYLMVWLEFESVAATAALLPLMLLVLERFRGRRRLAAAAAGGLVLGCIAVMGMLQYVIYSGILLGCYLLFVAAREARERGARRGVETLLLFGVTLAVAALLSAVTLLPTRDLIASSSRIGRSFGFSEFFARLGSMPARYWLTLVFPDFFGSPPLRFQVLPTAGGEYMNYNELCVYLGVPTLFGLLAALAASRRAHAFFFAGVTLAVGAMLMGNVLYYPFFRLVPGMDRMNPLRLIFILSFAAAATAAFGIRAAEEAEGRRARAIAAAGGVFALAVLLFSLAASGPAVAHWANREFFQAPGRDAYLGEFARLRSLGGPTVLLPLLTTLASAALLALFTLGRRSRPAAYALLVALLAADLVAFGRRYNTTARPEELYPETPGIAFLQGRPGPFRVLFDARAAFLHNSLAPFGLSDIEGYSSFYPERASLFLSYAEYGPQAFAGMRFDRWVTLSDLYSPFLDLANVRYVVTDPRAALGPPSRFREVFRGDVAIYENLDALPRAYAVPNAVARSGAQAVFEVLGSPAFDRRGTVVLEEQPDPAFLADASRAAVVPSTTVQSYGPDEVRIEAALPERGWLVLADTWYPGWEATVDGKPAPVLRANGNFRAVALRAGTHRVVFSYHPAAVARGRALTTLGLLLALGGIATAFVPRRRAGEAGGARG